MNQEFWDIILKRAKKLLVKYSGQDRKILGPVSLTPYEGDSNRVDFYLLEGSPHQGFIVAQEEVIRVYNGYGSLIREFDVSLEMLK